MAGKEAAKPRRLGRGLSSLIGDVGTIEVPVVTNKQFVETTISGGVKGVAAPVVVAAGGSVVVGGAQAGNLSRAATPSAPPATREGVAPVKSVEVAEPTSMARGVQGSGGGADGVRAGLGIVEIPVELFEANPFQPRREFEEGALRQLAESITRSGLMQPVVVRPAGKTAGGRQKYQLVAGERRWRAAQLANIARVPAVVRELSDAETAEWALVENVQREGLNVMEAAFAYKALAERFGLTHAEIGERVGLDRTTVVNTIRLTELEESIQRLMRLKELSAGHGKVLLAIPAGKSREICAQSAAEQGWSVRRLEAEARIVASTMAKPLPPQSQAERDKYLARNAARVDLEKQLGQWLGTRVTIKTTGSGTSGKLMVDFFGVDQFDGLLKKMGWKGE